MNIAHNDEDISNNRKNQIAGKSIDNYDLGFSLFPGKIDNLCGIDSLLETLNDLRGTGILHIRKQNRADYAQEIGLINGDCEFRSRPSFFIGIHYIHPRLKSKESSVCCSNN